MRVTKKVFNPYLDKAHGIVIAHISLSSSEDREILLQMNDIHRVLLHMIAEHQTQVRYLKNQSIYLTAFIVIMTLVVHAVLIRIGLYKFSLVFTILLIIFGAYGGIAIIKLYNQIQYHVYIIRELNHWLNEIHPNGEKQIPESASNDRQSIKNSILAKRSCFILWLGLFSLIAILGIIYTVIILR